MFTITSDNGYLIAKYSSCWYMSTSLRMFVHSPNNRVSSVGILVNRLVISKLTISDRLYKIGVFFICDKEIPVSRLIHMWNLLSRWQTEPQQLWASVEFQKLCIRIIADYNDESVVCIRPDVKSSFSTWFSESDLSLPCYSYHP